MSDDRAVICQLRGLGIRHADAVARIGVDFLHASGAELAYSDRSER